MFKICKEREVFGLVLFGGVFENLNERPATALHLGIKTLFLFPELAETGALWFGHAFDAFVNVVLVPLRHIGVWDFVGRDAGKELFEVVGWNVLRTP